MNPAIGPPVISQDDVTWTALRAQGAGGQNVNKVASAIHLRFDVLASALPEAVKARLLASGDQRVTPAGVVVIKAQRHRTQERNRADALARLVALVTRAADRPRPRFKTRVPRSEKMRRLEHKGRRADVKAGRRRPLDHD